MFQFQGLWLSTSQVESFQVMNAFYSMVGLLQSKRLATSSRCHWMNMHGKGLDAGLHVEMCFSTLFFNNGSPCRDWWHIYLVDMCCTVPSGLLRTRSL